MNRYLRSEKIALWNELVPTMDERLRGLKLAASSSAASSPSLPVGLSPVCTVNGGAAGTSIITDQIWILATICVIQTGLLLLAAILLRHSRKRYQVLERQIVAKI